MSPSPLSPLSPLSPSRLGDLQTHGLRTAFTAALLKSEMKTFALKEETRTNNIWYNATFIMMILWESYS